ncbi:MAG: multicopper oxidase domain-containing protein [Chloroflexi bacterium]|nr:multicopper oxidase domain-containing protein [Chloroflexota bacterium]
MKTLGVILGLIALLGVAGACNSPGSPSATSASQNPQVRQYTLVAEKVQHELAPGVVVTAWGYNGQVPGPEVRANEGDTVRVTFTNNLPVPTSVHWHGVDVPWNMDGVPGVSQQPVKPGETFSYEFVAKPAGTRFYHTHGSGQEDEASQLDMGLYGPLIIEPAVKSQAYDVEMTIMLDEWNTTMMADQQMQMGETMDYDVFTINAKAWPTTKPLVVKPDQRVLLRLINAGTSTFHPMHLHGHSFRVVAVDGGPVPLDQQQVRDTLLVAPGERYDIEFVANNPGVWVFHCHELHHADGGMIMLVRYEGYELPAGQVEPMSPSMPGMGH